jgi:hypothetical protein
MPPGVPAPKRGLGRGAIIGIVVVAVIVLVACVSGVFWFRSERTKDDYTAGKCIKRERADGADKAVPIDCDNDGAYRILTRVDDSTKPKDGDCPADTTVAFVNFNQKYVLCLKPQRTK